MEIDHVGSAHTDAALGLLLEAARTRLYPHQDAFDFGAVPQQVVSTDDIADWTRPAASLPLPPVAGGRPKAVTGGGRLVSTSAVLLWEVLASAYSRLGFDAIDDEAFKAMVLARIIEPTSKADTIRVLDEVGAPCPSLRTLFRALQRCQQRDYRNLIARACVKHCAQSNGLAAMVMYDVTTLHFEAKDEDKLRKVGMSKERRVDPQVQVGLLVDPAGFPLEIHLFEGNTAETTTLIPVLTSFQERHGITDMVVVADAGMLSAGNLNALEDAGFSFIVGSRVTKAPYDLADHFQRHGNYFTNGQILESTRVMGTRKAARDRRIVYQWLFKRNKHDDKAINAMIDRAERIASGQSSMRNARFLKVTGATKELNQATIDRARQLAGLKGYVTNLPVDAMSGARVIQAYHDLWQVEASFKMTKSDLKARPVFHHQRDAIEAHLSVVFAALAITRYLTATTEVSIKKLVTTLRTVRSATIEINGQHLVLDQEPPAEIQEILNRLAAGH